MKTMNYVGLGLLGAAILVGITGREVSAAEVVDQVKETPATVTIKDNDEQVDPLDPTDPHQKMLNLTKVPAQYNFETTTKDVDYSIDGTITNGTINVFNDRISRDWSVKASIKDNQLTVGDKKLVVNSFKLNEVELVGSGAKGIVAKSEENKTAENNTGTIVTPVNKVSIGFSDTDNVIKSGNTLGGIISYQLY
uniref:hypothetical protein n=1 Tax=Lactococcus garvieae TaxID=1363 RepID=UPI00254AE70F